jgi:hypothetical protein
MTADVSLRTVAPRPTAVVSQTTTWKQFPSVWRPLLDEVYGFVRDRPELAPEAGPEMWRNAFLYLDDRPTVEWPRPARPELGDLRPLARGPKRARDRDPLSRETKLSVRVANV